MRHTLRLTAFPALILALLVESCGGGGGSATLGQTGQLVAPPAPPAALGPPAVPAPADNGRAIDIFVLSPPNGAVIATPTLTVRVGGANWQELWVESSSPATTAGGIQPVRANAHPFQGDSFAVGVPVWEGTTRLVITGRRATGQALTRTIEVVHQPPSVEGVRLTVTPTTVSPATPVQIDAAFAGIGTPVEAWLDADGDGRLDASVSPTGSLSWSYAVEGYFAPRLVVRVANGILYDSASQAVPVTVASPPTLVDTPGAFELPVPARDIAVDRLNRRVLVLTQDSRLHVFDEAGLLVSAHTLAAVQTLVAIDVDVDGNVFAVDRAQHQLRKFMRASGFQPDASFGTNGVVGGLGTSAGQFNEPADVHCLHSLGSVDVWVADSGNRRLQRFDGNGAPHLELSTGADIAQPVSMTADFAGHVTVVDGADGDVAVFEFSGTRVAYGPGALGVDPSVTSRANVDVDLGVVCADPAGRALVRFERDGGLRSRIGLGSNVPLAVARTTTGHTLVAVAGAPRLQQLPGTEPFGESPVEVVTRFFTAVNQSADAAANELVAGETAPLLAAVLADPVKGPAYRALAGRVGVASELSRSDRLATVHAIVDPGTPLATPIMIELRRDLDTSRWLLLGL